VLFRHGLPFHTSGRIPQLFAASAPTVRGGQFYRPSGFQEARGARIEVQAVAAAHNPATGRPLWSVSEQLTGVTFPLQTPTTEPPGQHR